MSSGGRVLHSQAGFLIQCRYVSLESVLPRRHQVETTISKGPIVEYRVPWTPHFGRKIRGSRDLGYHVEPGLLENRLRKFVPAALPRGRGVVDTECVSLREMNDLVRDVHRVRRRPGLVGH